MFDEKLAVIHVLGSDLLTEFRHRLKGDYALTLVARNRKFSNGSRDLVITDDNCRGVVDAIVRRMPGTDEATAMSRVLKICEMNSISQSAGRDHKGQEWDRGRISAWKQCADMLRIALEDVARAPLATQDRP